MQFRRWFGEFLLNVVRSRRIRWVVPVLIWELFKDWILGAINGWIGQVPQSDAGFWLEKFAHALPYVAWASIPIVLVFILLDARRKTSIWMLGEQMRPEFEVQAEAKASDSPSPAHQPAIQLTPELRNARAERISRWREAVYERRNTHELNQRLGVKASIVESRL
jgi:hypothetical protein